LFDISGRAKWDAWASAGQSYSSATPAESRYITIAQELGWHEDIATPATQTVETREDDIWDSPTTQAPRSGGGMAASVSAMARPSEEGDNSLHSAAISNDISRLSTLFSPGQNTDVNAMDDFVRVREFGCKR
jgi:hypothetical protein